ADVSRRVPGPVAVLLLEAGGWRGESRGADGAGRSRRYRGRGSACLPRVSVDRRGADRRTAAGHHQGSHALLRAARDAATREGAEVGCQSDPGGGSRIARLLPAVGLAKDVGVRGLGIYPTFVHVDIRPSDRLGRSALIVVALLLLAVVPVSAQDADRGPSDRVLRISFAGAIAAHTADITTTAY